MPNHSSQLAKLYFGDYLISYNTFFKHTWKGLENEFIFPAIRVYLTVFASQIKMDFIFHSFKGENVFRQQPLVESIVVESQWSYI